MGASPLPTPLSVDAVSAGDRIEWPIQSRIVRHLPQRENVRFALAHPSRMVFVLDLYADDGAAVFPEESLQLPPDLTVEPLHIFQVGRVIPARLGFLLQPVRQSPIPHRSEEHTSE